MESLIVESGCYALLGLSLVAGPILEERGEKRAEREREQRRVKARRRVKRALAMR